MADIALKIFLILQTNFSYQCNLQINWRPIYKIITPMHFSCLHNQLSKPRISIEHLKDQRTFLKSSAFILNVQFYTKEFLSTCVSNPAADTFNDLCELDVFRLAVRLSLTTSRLRFAYFDITNLASEFAAMFSLGLIRIVDFLIRLMSERCDITIRKLLIII